MALRKIIEVEGEAFIETGSGRFYLGSQKSAFTAYCKIVSIIGNKESGRVNIECKNDGYSILKEYQVPFSVEENAPNFVKQAYEFIKTLPEWKDAADC